MENNPLLSCGKMSPGSSTPPTMRSAAFWADYVGRGMPYSLQGNNGYIVGPKRQAAYRVLDAQFFGVAQRRRRVFVVASARNGFDPSSILFEFDGVRRDSPPSRETRENPTDCTGGGFAESSFGQYRPVIGDGATIKASGGALGGGSENFIVHGTQDPLTRSERAFPLGCNSGQENAVFAIQGSMIGRNDSAGPQGSGVSDDVSFTLTRGDRHGVALYCGTQNDACRDVGVEIAPTLRSGSGGGAVNQVVNVSLVRRLTPKECERLQGFPDDWTKIPYRGKDAENCPDGPRYAACGNSMAVPVMHWIGKRIDALVNIEYHAGRGVYL